MKPLLFIGSLLFFALCGHTQVLRTPVTSTYISLHTYSTQHKDAFSFAGNSASLAGNKRVSAGMYSERRFMVQELSSYSFGAALPTPSGNFGLKGTYTGSGLYNESGLGLAYARKMGTKVSVGLGFDYLSLRASGYGSASALTFDAGAVVHLTETVQAGISVYNPVSMSLGKGDEKLASIYTAGIGYDASPQLFLGAELQKVEDQPLNMAAGLQYLFAEKLVARAGVNTATESYYFGFGYRFKNLRLDATASVHPSLGLSPGLMLVYAPQE